jgi:hypothetical protein
MMPSQTSFGSSSIRPRRSFKEEEPIIQQRESLPVRRQKLLAVRRRTLWSMASVAVLLVVATVSHHHYRNSMRSSRPNPFQASRRLLVEETTSSTTTAIRYLSLGGASTWGVGLANPEPVVTVEAGVTTINTHEAAYPFRLSPEVHNAAQRVGGPTLAALCSQSIVEEGIYDVITLEFSNAYHESDLVALDLLAHRLRHRFPSAVLVIVQLWSPAHYYYNTENNGGTVEFATWRRRQQQQQQQDEKLNGEWDSTDWKVMLQGVEWKYSQQVASATARLQEIADQLQGHLVHLAPPQDPIHGLETASTWFTEILPVDESTPGDMEKDHHHSSDDDGTSTFQYTLSSKGHLVVANHIRSFVDQANILKRSLEERNVLAAWESGDQCQLWYDYDPNGERSSTMIPKHSSSLTLQAFAADKYALEVPQRGGSIVVENSFSEDRMLYLTYMTTSTTSTHKIYPQVQVQLVQQGQTLKKNGVVIDPYHDDDTDQRHVTRTTAIGKVPALSSVEVRIQPLQDTVAPFRLVGASFLAKEKVQWQIASEFDLEPERVHAGRRLHARDLRIF